MPVDTHSAEQKLARRENPINWIVLFASGREPALWIRHRGW
jgi:hypothetical protein